MGHNETHLSQTLDKLLQDKFTCSFRSGYVNCGNVLMPNRYESLKQQIDDFEVFDDDVWVCSFPKTGTTWTQEMVWMICNDCNYKGAEETLCTRYPFLELSVVMDYRQLKTTLPGFIPLPYIDDSLGFVAALPRPRYIKTHLPWSMLPKQIKNFEKKPKIIYVSRNPKETCVSYFHHSTILEGFTGDFQDFYQLFINGKVIFGPFWENVLSYWHVRNCANIHFIKYEDMMANLTEVIQHTAAYLGKKVTEQQIVPLLKHLSFESMKVNSATNFGLELDFFKKWNLMSAEGVFMRSGKKDGYKNVLSKEQIEEMDRWSDENTANTGFNNTIHN